MPAFRAVLKNTVALRLAMLSLVFLFIPAFSYGVVCLWGIAFLFVFVHLGRVLCQSSLRLYEERLSYTNEPPCVKRIVIELCAYLGLPFVAYFLIVGDVDTVISSGLDRELILSLPLEAIKLPIDGEPIVSQFLLLQQILLSCFGFAGGMLYARKEIGVMSLHDVPNIRTKVDMTEEESERQGRWWVTYYYLPDYYFYVCLFAFIFVSMFFSVAWVAGGFNIFSYVFVLPFLVFMPFFIFSLFLSIAFGCILTARM